MINAIALDDEFPALKILGSFCERSKDLIQLKESFTNVEEAKQYLESNEVDLIFLDVNMPQQSGIDFYKGLEKKPSVIFTTAYTEFAVEGFNLKAVDYLLKPFKYERFVESVKKAKELSDAKEIAAASTQRHFFVRADYSQQKVSLDDLEYVEALNDYLRIVQTFTKPIVARMTMKEMEKKLPSTEFMRVHRSYIVSLKKITQVRNKVINIGDKEIGLSRGYFKQFSQRIKEGA